MNLVISDSVGAVPENDDFFGTLKNVFNFFLLNIFGYRYPHIMTVLTCITSTSKNKNEREDVKRLKESILFIIVLE